MTLLEDLEFRGLISQLTDEEGIKELLSQSDDTVHRI